MSKFKEIELDAELEKVFSATDTLVAHLSRELGRTESECIMAMVTWLEERQKTQYCRITVPKTDKTIAAAQVLPTEAPVSSPTRSEAVSPDAYFTIPSPSGPNRCH